MESRLAASGLALLHLGMVAPELEPGQLPAFADPARASGAPPSVSDDVLTFDHELIPDDPDAPTAGVRNRRTEIARRAARGERNCDIASALGYTQAWVSTVMKDPFVQAEIKRYRDALMETDAMGRLKLAAPDAAERLHRSILDPKDRGGLEASKFVLEMTHGKPRQAINVESNSLSAFMEMLTAMRSRGEVIDVGPEVRSTEGLLTIGQRSDAQRDEFDQWLDQHLSSPA